MDENKLKALAAELAKGLKTEADLNADEAYRRNSIQCWADWPSRTWEKCAQKGSNTRNSYSSKILLCDDGKIELNTPHDRENTF